MEYSVPAERGVECFLEVRDLIRTKHRQATWPVEYRTVAADEILISPAQGRATVAISIHEGATLPHAAFFDDAEKIFRRHQGRPHWAKLHSLGRTRAGRALSRVGSFSGRPQATRPRRPILEPASATAVRVVAIKTTCCRAVDQNPIERPMISFMISVVPPKMVCTRLSMKALAIGYSSM